MPLQAFHGQMLCFQVSLFPGAVVGEEATLGIDTVGFPGQHFTPHSIVQVSALLSGRWETFNIPFSDFDGTPHAS
jgi:hypothetical protein